MTIESNSKPSLLDLDRELESQAVPVVGAPREDNEAVEILRQILERQTQSASSQAVTAQRAERQVVREEQQVLAGRDAFFENEALQQATGLQNPSGQPWYGRLPDNEKKSILFRYRMLQALEVKRSGSGSLPEFKRNLRFRKEELQQTLIDDKVHRIALATITRDLYEIGSLNPRSGGIESGPDAKGVRLSEKGEKVLQDQDPDTREASFVLYRDSVVDALKDYYLANPNLIPFGFYDPSSPNGELDLAATKAARESFAVVWNFLSVGLVNESADHSRKVSSSDSVLIVPSWRTMIHPHAQAVSKWVKNQAESVGFEENLFGALGVWCQERIRHDATVKDGFANYRKGYRFFPRVSSGSLLDHSYYSSSSVNSGKTLGDALLDNSNKRMVPTRSGHILYDYGNPNAVSMIDLADADVGASYGDTLDTVGKVINYITVDNPNKNTRNGFSEFVGSLQGLIQKSRKGDRVFAAVVTPENIEDVIIAGCGAAGGGFLEYTSDLLLRDVSELNYDTFVANTLLADDRIWTLLGVNLSESGKQAERDRSEARRRIMGRLNAMNPARGTFGATFLDQLGMGRAGVRRAAEMNKRRFTGV